MCHLLQKMLQEGQSYKVSSTNWRVNYEVRKQINEQPEEGEEGAEDFAPVYEQAHIQFEILRVPDRENVFFIQFKRKGGAAILFYENTKLYRD
mmetsp:Transcript_24528/g.28910  ORF Transcript_24528/g.28910 Transcript_24528/m.28910 type:complete len:93 (+) Transcript_24528:1180-1458(+)